METKKNADEALCLPVQGPDPVAGTLPPGFVPLRLVLEASGASVELLRSDMIVGRHSEADIRLPLPDVSRRHCRFVFEDGNWYVYDLNSLNGVFVNDEPVTYSMIRQSDRIRIGGFSFAVDFLPATLQEEGRRPLDDVLISIYRAGPKKDAA